MAGTAMKVFLAIIAILLGIGMFYFWEMLRPDDTLDIRIIVSIVVAIASFISLYSMTKSHGS